MRASRGGRRAVGIGSGHKLGAIELRRRLGVPDGFSERSTDVDGAKLCWIERPGADADAPTLVLFPGVGMTFRAYAWLVPLLPPQPRVLIVDPPGCGDSDVLDNMSVQDQADRLAAWLHTEGGGPFHLAGHSLGAVLAARVAARLGREAVSLTMLSPAPDGTRPKLRQHVGALVIGAPGEAPRALVQATVDYLTARPEVMLGFRSCLDGSPESVLAGVSAAVTVARGRHDRVVHAGWAGRLAARGNGRLHTVRRAGHGLPQQRPAAVARILRDVLAGAGGSGQPGSPGSAAIGSRSCGGTDRSGSASDRRIATSRGSSE